MMKTLSKMRKASRARNRTATMMAAFMFGRTTLRVTSQRVPPSTRAASVSSPGTCASPASSSSEMKGVVFQISLAMITTSAGAAEPNQLKRSEEHTSELQSRGHLVCRLLLEKKKEILNTLKPDKIVRVS